jgi:uncharacterized protein YqkB
MSYAPADPTGEDVSYAVTGDVYRLYENSQKIVFANGPVYLDSIVMKDASDPNTTHGPSGWWEAGDDDIDTTSMSKMKADDASFADTLVKSITILRDISTYGEERVSLSYQQLYPVSYVPRYGDVSAIELTPGLVASLLGRLSSVEQQIGGGAALATPIDVETNVLDRDIHKANVANAITGEAHNVDTSSGKSLIQPSHGAFFKDSVTVTVDATDTELTLGEDYSIIDMDVGLTTITNNASGIFNFIHITTELVGTVNIDYHAVGGDVHAKTVNEIIVSLNKVIDVIRGNDFLTSESLASSAYMSNLLSRLTSMEERMRILALTGTPNYGDATDGVAVRKVLTAVDTDFHWYTIAKMFKVTGAEDVYTVDRFNFRMRLTSANIMADISVAANVDSDRHRFTIETLNAMQDAGYVLFGDADVASSVRFPQFRIIWNTDAGVADAGMYLQIGIANPGLTDTLVIEDHSGKESAWILDTTSGAITPSDDAVTLPDGLSTWTDGDADSHSEARMMPTADNLYRAWSGSTDMDELDLDDAVTHLLPDEFRIEDVKKIRLVVVDSGNTFSYFVDIPMVYAAAGSMTGRASMVEGGAAIANDLVAKLSKAGSTITLNVGPSDSATWDAVVAGHALKYILMEV